MRNSSTSEAVAACIHSDGCGGCQYQGLPYEEQLKTKQKLVEDLLTQAGMSPKLGGAICPSPVRYCYRNKMEYTFGNTYKDGPLTLGLHKQKNFMSIVYTGECQIVPTEFNDLLKETLVFCQEQDYTFYNKKSHKGLLRSLILRKGVRTGEFLVNIVTTTQSKFDSAAFRDRLLALSFAEHIVGILHTINDGVSDAVNCDEMDILHGRDYYNEELMGLRFKVGAFSFFQTNVEAVERMFTDALALIPSLEGKLVWDLYSGTGTLAQTVAPKAQEAIGVELSEESVAMARLNALQNGLSNCSFIAGDVLKVLDDMTALPDVIIVDPPRSGIHPKAMKKIVSYGVPYILYISCNPKTLIRNLPEAMEAGYRIESFRIYDNFPFTRHVETVVLITRAKE